MAVSTGTTAMVKSCTRNPREAANATGLPMDWQLSGVALTAPCFFLGRLQVAFGLNEATSANPDSVRHSDGAAALVIEIVGGVARSWEIDPAVDRCVYERY